MSDDDAEVLETKLTLHFGATIAVSTGVQWSDYIKPSAEFSHKWRGVPSADQLVLAAQFTHNQVLAPMLEDIIRITHERMVEARRGR